MWKLRSKCELVVMIFVFVLSLQSPASTSGSPILNAQLTQAIMKVREGRTAIDRMEAARGLVELTQKIDSTQLDDTTLENLVSLLDSPEDGVRFWVAASLGNLGPRASMGVPKLLKSLAEVDCLRVQGLNSAGTIRTALEKIGVAPPPRKCR
jgi:hypothetical protein